MLIWCDARHGESRRAWPRLSGKATCSWALLVMAVALASHLATHDVVLRGPAAVRALEQATAVNFGGVAPASPDIAIFEIGPPIARRVVADTIDMVFVVPGRDDPTRLLHVAVRWVHEAAIHVIAWR